MNDHIEQANTQFCTALAAGDGQAVAAVYAPGARLLAPGSELITGTDAIAGFWSAGIGAGIRSAELTTLSVEELDDVAIEVGRYALEIEMDAGKVTDVGKYVVVHRRSEDGSWRWDLDVFNSDTPGT